MHGMLLCVLAAGAPVPPVPMNQAPPPRLVKPDISLVVTDVLRPLKAPQRQRVLRISFRNGKPLPAEVLWDTDKPELKLLDGGLLDRGTVRANRYLVAASGIVFDLHDKKLINNDRSGEVIHTDDAKVTYWITGENREAGLFTFEYSTAALTRIDKLKEPRIPAGVKRSPDNTHAVNWVDGELFLHRDGVQPRSLGKGFKSDREVGVLVGSGFSMFPVLWLDDKHFLTQRDTGKLVTVNLDGKVADVVAIKDLPQGESFGLFRDHGGSIIYYVGEKNFVIDPAKKTATPTVWGGLGHGFEISWNADADDLFKFRHNGKDIGRCACWPYEGVPAPGYLAVMDKLTRKKIAVWCASSGEWTTFEVTWDTNIVGWMK